MHRERDAGALQAFMNTHPGVLAGIKDNEVIAQPIHFPERNAPAHSSHVRVRQSLRALRLCLPIWLSSVSFRPQREEARHARKRAAASPRYPANMQPRRAAPAVRGAHVLVPSVFVLLLGHVRSL